MRYLFLGLKLAVFIVLLLLAMQNSQLVSLNLLLGGVWEAPLILLLLAFLPRAPPLVWPPALPIRSSCAVSSPR